MGELRAVVRMASMRQTCSLLNDSLRMFSINNGQMHSFLSSMKTLDVVISSVVISWHSVGLALAIRTNNFAALAFNEGNS